MKKALFASFVLLAANVAVGQYTTTHVKYPLDITTYATSGTNAWKYLPGNQVCLLGSLAVGAELSIWCAGNDGVPVRYDPKNYVWDRQGQMGTVAALALTDSNALFSLRSTSQCPGQYGIFRWFSAGWSPRSGCYVKLSSGWDGILQAIDNTNQKWTSSDGANTWTKESGWSFASDWGKGIGCSITSGGQVNIIAPPPAVSPRALPSIPSGMAVGCVLFYDDSGSQLMSWNSAGTAYLIDLNPTTSGWSTVAGPSITQIGGYQKAWLIGLDSTGKPYHWNVNAMYVASTTTGTFTSCPGIPQLQCHQTTPIHAGYLRTRFSSGHGINYNAGIQSTLIAPSTNMNLTSWDIAPQCDPLLGHPDDPECTSDTYGYEHCNQANADLPNNPTQNPDSNLGESIAVSGFVRTRGYGGPYLTDSSTPTEGAWYGIVTRDYYDACFEFGPNEPTCPVDYSAPFNKVMMQRYHSQPQSEFAMAEVQSMMEVAIMGEDMPVIIWQPYIMVNGVAQCTGQTRETESFGFRPAIPACQ